MFHIFCSQVLAAFMVKSNNCSVDDVSPIWNLYEPVVSDLTQKEILEESLKFVEVGYVYVTVAFRVETPPE